MTAAPSLLTALGAVCAGPAAGTQDALWTPGDCVRGTVGALPCLAVVVLLAYARLRPLSVTLRGGTIRVAGSFSPAPRAIACGAAAWCRLLDSYRLTGLALHLGRTCYTNSGDWIYGVPAWIGMWPSIGRWRPRALQIGLRTGQSLVFVVPAPEALAAALQDAGVPLVGAAPTEDRPERHRPPQ